MSLAGALCALIRYNKKGKPVSQKMWVRVYCYSVLKHYPGLINLLHFGLTTLQPPKTSIHLVLNINLQKSTCLFTYLLIWPV